LPIYRLTNELIFPDAEEAENGIVAIGGDLSTDRLILAYKSGIFPWFSADEPIIWWCPDPRFVLVPNELKVSKSMKQLFQRKTFEVSMNQNFEHIIHQCSISVRDGQDDTWIVGEMEEAYINLHKNGIAHSVEVWQNGEIVGGLYGLIIGKVFFGESMFFTVSNASKYGFIWLVNHLIDIGIELIDCQVETEHLASLGAKIIPRNDFLELLRELVWF